MANDTKPAYEELRKRVLDGDTTITAAALEKARAEAAFADLTIEARAAAAEREARAEQARQVDELRNEVVALGEGQLLPELRDAYGRAVAAIRDLETGLKRWHARRTALAGKASALDSVGLLDDLPQLRKADQYVALAFDEAAGKLDPAQAIYHGVEWNPTHELHDESTRSAMRAAIVEARAERERQREREHAETLARIAEEREERLAEQRVAEARRRTLGQIAPR